MARVERESINFKLPKPLVEALRSAAHSRNTSATDLVIEGLHMVMGAVPGLEGSIEIRLQVVEEEVANLAANMDTLTEKSRETYLIEKVSNLEGKLEITMRRLEQLASTVLQVQQNNNASRLRL